MLSRVLALLAALLLAFSGTVVASEVKLESLHEPACEVPSKPGDTVRFWQRGVAKPSNTILDDNFGGAPTQMKLAADASTASFLDQALAQACVGARRRLTVLPALAARIAAQTEQPVPSGESVEYELELAQILPEIGIEIVVPGRDCTVKSKRGDSVRFFQRAKIAATGAVFESNFGDEPLEMKLGTHELGETMMDMCVGERRKLIVPAHLTKNLASKHTEAQGQTLEFELELAQIVAYKQEL